MKKNFILSVLVILALCFSLNIANAQTDPSLVLGTFKLTKVIDGDTFRLDSLPASVRLLCIDTEETFKGDSAEIKLQQIEPVFLEFYNTQKGTNKYPVKTDSPLGYEAWKWAEGYLAGVTEMRLEKDDNTRDKDGYGRLLVYGFVMKDGKEVNYNVECVRNGYSPYFNKYGESKRFHSEFVEAQEYARANKLGIWDPNKKHYPDYEERLVWWNKRAQQLKDFETKHSNVPDYINLSDQNDFAKLEEYLGKDVIVFGSIGEILTAKYPNLITFPFSKEKRFELVVFEDNKAVMDEMDWSELKEHSVYVSGKLEKYKEKYQIKLTDKKQVWME